jgi:hypothetical protein
MREAGHRLRLAQHALVARRLRGEPVSQELDCDWPIEIWIARGIDDPHAAEADRPEHLIAPDAATLLDVGALLIESVTALLQAGLLVEPPRGVCDQLPARGATPEVFVGHRAQRTIQRTFEQRQHGLVIQTRHSSHLVRCQCVRSDSGSRSVVRAIGRCQRH